MFNWIKNFLCDRTIQVRVGTVLSEVYRVENGTPQGSVISPVLFNIMVNDMLSNFKGNFGVSLFADDGAIWKRGRNLEYIVEQTQKALNGVVEWANKEKAAEIGICNMKVGPTICWPEIPQWLWPEPEVDLSIKNKINERRGDAPKIVQEHQYEIWGDSVYIYTDGSKDPSSGKAAFGMYIWDKKKGRGWRLPDKTSVYTAELFAILCALRWIEKARPLVTVICSDSISALQSIENRKSKARPDILTEIFLAIIRIQKLGGTVGFMWVPAHAGIQGNEAADQLAKEKTSSNESQ
uniref:RNase H type-1 domain-containing protein n=1 Tax=Myripristis murdjan TaxID=586833 RepID=A0A667ZNI8_9TELE